MCENTHHAAVESKRDTKETSKLGLGVNKVIYKIFKNINEDYVLDTEDLGRFICFDLVKVNCNPSLYNFRSIDTYIHLHSIYIFTSTVTYDLLATTLFLLSLNHFFFSSPSFFNGIFISKNMVACMSAYEIIIIIIIMTTTTTMMTCKTQNNSKKPSQICL